MTEPSNTDKPWVSFCMSTFNRPVFLKNQLDALSRQSFTNFEVIVSDNDPYRSAEEIVKKSGDNRFRYFNNMENLGMVKSFNKSIDRASADYIVMITDDDPVDEDFLMEMHQLCQQDPSCSLYAGFNRRNIAKNEIEKISPSNFINEILDVNKTNSLLWSSCVMMKNDVIAVGKMPDYGSPHFADQALIAMTGSRNGGLIINKMFSSLSTHDSNFSKSNFHLYIIGCEGFYKWMNEFCIKHPKYKEEKKAITIHLGKWFFGCIFTLKKYFTLNGDKNKLRDIMTCANEILTLPYMKKYKTKYYGKTIVFQVKKFAGIL